MFQQWRVYYWRHEAEFSALDLLGRLLRLHGIAVESCGCPLTWCGGCCLGILVLLGGCDAALCYRQAGVQEGGTSVAGAELKHRSLTSRMHVRHGTFLSMLGAAVFPARRVRRTRYSGLRQRVWTRRRKLLCKAVRRQYRNSCGTVLNFHATRRRGEQDDILRVLIGCFQPLGCS